MKNLTILGESEDPGSNDGFHLAVAVREEEREGRKEEGKAMRTEKEPKKCRPPR